MHSLHVRFHVVLAPAHMRTVGASERRRIAAQSRVTQLVPDVQDLLAERTHKVRGGIESRSGVAAENGGGGRERAHSIVRTVRIGNCLDG